MTSNTLALTVTAIVALLVGGLIGAVGFSKETTRDIPRDVIKEVTKEVPVEVLVEVPADVNSLRDQAIETVWAREGDDDDFLTCGDHTYESDEVRISKLYDEWAYEFLDETDNVHAVTYTARYSFKELDNDDKACKDTRTYTVTYEDGEKPDVDLH